MMTTMMMTMIMTTGERSQKTHDYIDDPLSF